MAKLFKIFWSYYDFDYERKMVVKSSVMFVCGRSFRESNENTLISIKIVYIEEEHARRQWRSYREYNFISFYRRACH